MQDDESIGFQRTRKERVYWIKINEDTVEEIDGLTPQNSDTILDVRISYDYEPIY